MLGTRCSWDLLAARLPRPRPDGDLHLAVASSGAQVALRALLGWHAPSCHRLGGDGRPATAQATADAPPPPQAQKRLAFALHPLERVDRVQSRGHPIP